MNKIEVSMKGENMEEICELPHERMRSGQRISEGCSGRHLERCGLGKADCSLSCKRCIAGIMNQLADEIERRYVPIPRFEDGEPVSKGCEADGGIVDSWIVWDDGRFVLRDSEYRRIQKGYLGEFVRRPEAKKRDADDVEICEGDTVYLLPGDHCEEFPLRRYKAGIAYRVVKNDSEEHREDGRICISGGGFPRGYPLPEQVTHREPDSLEKLRDEMQAYADGGVSCIEDDLHMFADRLTALMERGA